MSQLTQGIFACLAAALTLGAVQLTSGCDFRAVAQDIASATATDATVNINRGAKADRPAAVPAPAGRTRTISFRLDSLAATSVVIRMPVSVEARRGSSAPAVVKSGNRKMTVACEPVVSVLTEIAKQLQPGRCVT
jgi:hypothetical protein